MAAKAGVDCAGLGNKQAATGVESLRPMSDDGYYVINEVVTKRLGHIPILKVPSCSIWRP